MRDPAGVLGVGAAVGEKGEVVGGGPAPLAPHEGAADDQAVDPPHVEHDLKHCALLRIGVGLQRAHAGDAGGVETVGGVDDDGARLGGHYDGARELQAVRVVRGQPEAAGVVGDPKEVLVPRGRVGAHRRQEEAARGDAGQHLELQAAQRRGLSGLAVDNQRAQPPRERPGRRVALRQLGLGDDARDEDGAPGLDVAPANHDVHRRDHLEARGAGEGADADGLHEREVQAAAAIRHAVEDGGKVRRGRQGARGDVDASVALDELGGRRPAARRVDAGGAADELGVEPAAEGERPVAGGDGGVVGAQEVGFDARAGALGGLRDAEGAERRGGERRRLVARREVADRAHVALEIVEV